MAKRNNRDNKREEPEFDERIVDINRVAKVVKGGRRFAFRVVMVSGDNRGRVGVGIGKANSVVDGIKKASERAKADMRPVVMVGGTIPHESTTRYSGAEVFMKPATPGTGVIAGGAVRAVLECAGVKDILTKSKGSQNKLNVIQATIRGLRELKNPREEAERRGKAFEDVKPIWS